MKTKHPTIKTALIGLCLATLTGIMAFQDSTIVRSQLATLDTLPKNPDIHIDIDMKDVDKAMKELEIQLHDVGKHMKEVDWEKISNQINQSMKNIDMAKIQLDIEKSLKDVNWDHIKLDIEKSMKDVKRELEKARIEIDLNKVDMKKEMEKARGDMEKAKEEMKKAKEEMNDIKEMVSEMEKDSLLDTKKSYNVEYKDKELYINGKKQPAEVKEKYQKYIKGEKFKLSRSGDGALAIPPCNGIWISAYI